MPDFGRMSTILISGVIVISIKTTGQVHWGEWLLKGLTEDVEGMQPQQSSRWAHRVLPGKLPEMTLAPVSVLSDEHACDSIRKHRTFSLVLL